MKKLISNILNFLPNKVFGRSEGDNEIETFMRTASKFAVAVAFISVAFFFVYLIGASINGEDNKLGQLGTIGDFFGGTLNPTFAFIGLMALLYTLRQNQKELTQATEQMRKSAEAAELQVKQDEQQHLLEVLSAEIDKLFSSRISDTSNLADLSIDYLTSLMNGNKQQQTSTLFSTKDAIHKLNENLILCLLQLEKITSEHQKITNSNSTRVFYATKYFMCIDPLIKNEILISTVKGFKTRGTLKLLYFSLDSIIGNKIEIRKNIKEIEEFLANEAAEK